MLSRAWSDPTPTQSASDTSGQVEDEFDIPSRHRWLALHATDLIDRLQTWADQLKEKENQKKIDAKNTFENFCFQVRNQLNDEQLAQAVGVDKKAELEAAERGMDSTKTASIATKSGFDRGRGMVQILAREEAPIRRGCLGEGA